MDKKMTKKQFNHFNSRRVYLIYKDNNGDLSEEESKELEEVSCLVFDYVNEQHPLPFK